MRMNQLSASSYRFSSCSRWLVDIKQIDKDDVDGGADRVAASREGRSSKKGRERSREITIG